ncbi:hypothetical protein JKP88DRAFT_347060 [Tribonema minus]|uniref:RNA-binding S4 domain-containing protein n=1 Tax=Tribonema minus TaxID=303371 RepID=A0A835YSP6_9STRA|nr:hypothetical protein JKP88DRAFT_347060 [Tribonema minus]
MPAIFDAAGFVSAVLTALHEDHFSGGHVDPAVTLQANGSHEPSVDDDEQEQPQQQQQQEEWTEDRISRKISVLQRKLRDVKALEVLAVTDPDSLNADQQVKLGRKASLAQEIAALEKARRQLQQGSAPPSTAPAFASAPAGDFEGEGEGEGDGEGGPQGTGEHLHGLPKKLGTVLSYCRVSTRETCEMLVAIGRVTVNGEVVTNADKKVDILNDEIIANGARVEIPDKFDNTFSAPPVDEGEARPRGGKKRTGPLPKSEKPKTWKQLTKYTWKVDGGLMARKVRGIKPKDGIFIDREDKPPRRDRRY